MNRILRIGLIAVCCSVLNGFGTARAQVPAVAPPSGSGPTQKQGKDLSDHEIGAPDERWKSCARLVDSNGSHSNSDLEGIFERPQNVAQMLQNLKLAWQRDLLLQPSFYDPAILRRFFNSEMVVWKEPDRSFTANTSVVVGQLNSDAISGVSIVVESRCWQTDSLSQEGRPQTTVTLVSFLKIDGRAGSKLDLDVVRGVFGSETRNVTDRGVSDHGFTYSPTYRGKIVYQDSAKVAAEGISSLGVTFFYGPVSSRSGPESFGETDTDDLVQKIEIDEAKHHLLEK